MANALILASQSPRRQALLAALGLAFTVDVADVDERPLRGEAPAEMVARLSRAKASVVAGRHGGAAVLAADTVVTLDGRALGKPADPAEAASMLKALRGRTHQVYTGVSIAHAGASKTQLSCSDVTMRPYTDHQIRAYVATGDPLDKAGAYAIQHPAFSPVMRWEGCYSGIMGLPLGVVAELLTWAGLAIPYDVTGVCERWSGSCCLRMRPPARPGRLRGDAGRAS